MAKLEFHQVRDRLQRAADLRVVLLYGEDAGLVRERADSLVSLICDGEAMRVIDIGKEAARDTGLLMAEAATMALIGGRQAVRVREAGDAFAAGAGAALGGPGPGVVLFEAGELPPRSRLRALLEAHPLAGVVACWPERGVQLAASVDAMLNELGVVADPGAVDFIVTRAGDDRQRLRRECEKLALYVGAGRHVSPDDAMVCLGDGGDGGVEAAIGAAFAGELPEADLALDAALAEGTSAVQILRAALLHGQRLLPAVRMLAGGSSAATATAAARPPIFPGQRAAFERALRRWDAGLLTAGLAGLLRAERRAKSSGLPEQVVARHAISAIARLAASRR